MLSYSFRPATEDDAPALAEIEKRVHIAPWSVENIRQELAKPYSRILLVTDDETDTEIAAYVVFWMMGNACEVLNVAVDLPFRGQGHAKALLRKVVALAVQEGMSKVFLDVRKSNNAAIQLYQAVGFYILHLRKNFYSDGEDAYEMVILPNEKPIDF